MTEQSRKFAEEVAQNLAKQAEDDQLRQLSRDWMADTIRHKYSYNFSWLGRPIIQYPQDIVAMQELLWKVQPDLISKPVSPTGDR